MDESKWEYLQENSRLISAVAKKIGKAYNDRYGEFTWDELYSTALMLAAICLRSYDPEKGEFSTYYMNAAKHPARVMRHMKTGHYHELGYALSTEELLRPQESQTDHGEGKQRDVSWSISPDQLEDEVDREFMTEKLYQAISKLPEHLRQHALDTLEGTVCWKDTSSTVAMRRQMLQLLREEMTWE
jgi:DNA-directed RNA polymerase specialized sigma subunit